MFTRAYKVKGEDVNDFMIMQNFAYLEYSAKLIDVFLFEKGFPKLKLNSLKIGWQKKNDRLVNERKLMFTESFIAHLRFSEENSDDSSTMVFVDFFNEKNELCATLTTELSWFDYENWKLVVPPKKITKHFFSQKQYRRAV